jgi:hypothetical protein
LTTIPHEVVKGLAGFDPKKSAFCLPRASVIPPEALNSLVFPWIEDWIAKLDACCLELMICLNSFLKTMLFLRIVFLQDAVCLKELLPNLFIWNHSTVFRVRDAIEALNVRSFYAQKIGLDAFYRI